MEGSYHQILSRFMAIFGNYFNIHFCSNFYSMRNIKIIYFLCFPLLLFGQLNVDSLSHINYQSLHGANLNDVWGYVDELGNEYAIVGTSKGTSIVNVTNPSNPFEVFWLPGSESIWRDPCVYGNYAFVTTEADDGLTIIDLTPLPQSPNLNSTIYTGPIGNSWQSAHTCYVDPNGYAYIFGVNRGNGGVIMLDVNTDPMNPIEVGVFDNWYIHDGYVRNDTLFAAHIYDGFFSIVDVSNKALPVLLGTRTTPSFFTHNIWPSDNGQFVFTTDEISGAYIAAYDISNPALIEEVDKTRNSAGSGVIPHNVHVRGNYLVTSYYSDGIVIHDATHPNNLIKVGQYYTYPTQTSSYDGCWGVYPFLPSGTILAADITQGLFILGPTYVQASYLDGFVTDSQSGLSLSGVKAQIIGNDQFEITPVSGYYATGILGAGQYSVTFSKVGYYSKTEIVDLVQGEVYTLPVQLDPIPPFLLSIEVYDAQSGTPVSNADIKLYHPLIVHEGVTNGIGQESFTLYYADQYRIAIGKWGNITSCSYVNINETTGTLIFNLEKGFYDDFEFDFGWSVTGNAETGSWVRGKPNLTSNTVIGVDADFDCGDNAYITGNLDNPFNPDLDDVDNGFTQLLSPQFNVNGMTTPHINYAIAYYCLYGPGLVDDTLQVFLSNGTNQILLDEIIPPQQYMNWLYKSIPIPTGFSLNNTLQLKIIASDYSPNVNVTEAMFDWFYVTDYDASGIENLTNQLTIYPNPVDEILNIEDVDSEFPIEIFDGVGQKIFNQQVNQSYLQLNCSSLNAGLYTIKNGRNVFKFIKN